MISSLIPLEMSEVRDKSEGFDGCQKDLLNAGAYDLILIENASEVAKENYIFPNLDKILEQIAVEFENALYLPSEVFPYDADKEILVNNKISDYHAKYSALIKPNTFIFSILAVEHVDDFIAHYGAFIYYNGVLDIYDSMTFGEITSAYSSTFKYMGIVIFNPSELRLNPCLKPFTIQPTGGFPSIYPLGVKQELHKLYLKECNKIKKLNIHPLEKLEKFEFIQKKYNEYSVLIRIQSMESQDHFCFMWSIYFIIAKLSGFDLNKLAEEFPLLVIKTFIHLIINYLKLQPQFFDGQKAMIRKKIYNSFFKSVWVNKTWDKNSKNILDLNYQPMDLQFVKVARNLRECILLSIENNIIWREKIIPPEKVYKRIQQVDDECYLDEKPFKSCYLEMK